MTKEAECKKLMIILRGSAVRLKSKGDSDEPGHKTLMIGSQTWVAFPRAELISCRLKAKSPEELPLRLEPYTHMEVSVGPEDGILTMSLKEPTGKYPSQAPG